MKNDSRFYQVYITTNEPIADSDDMESVACDNGEFIAETLTSEEAHAICDVYEGQGFRTIVLPCDGMSAYEIDAEGRE